MIETIKGKHEIIIAIDPGYKNLGWVIAEYTREETKSHFKVIEMGVSSVAEWNDKDMINLVSGVSAWVEELRQKVSKLTHFVPRVFIEKQYATGSLRFVGQRLQLLETVLFTSLYETLKFTMLELYDKPIILLSSSAIKSFFGIRTTSREQNKIKLIALLKDQYNIKVDNEHIADCIGILIFASNVDTTEKKK